ncbi:MAG: retropepsin-like domain-containing protein, partial [Candidatus Rokubacteria bacterium]|nr:retropepsin-like domain-containing protein [Candidatus Rokubacteria bacterium]
QRKIEREPLVLEFDYIPDALQAFGPIINTDLTITPTHRKALEEAGQPIPPNVNCRFLIDTGSDGTIVKHQFAEQAGLKLINASVPLHGVGVDTTGRVYIGRIVFGLRSRISDAVQHQIFIDTQIRSARLETDRIDGLIGRDVLRHFVLSCDGRTGQVRMKYHRPPASP